MEIIYEILPILEPLIKAGTAGIVLVLGAFIIAILYVGRRYCLDGLWWMFGRKYPVCKKTNALERTGKEKEGGLVKTASENTKIVRKEWKCIHCGYRVWRETEIYTAMY